MRTAEEIRADITVLRAELSSVSGEGVLIWDGQGDVADIPAGGALLDVQWAVADRSYQVWFPDLERAKAALLALALENDTIPAESGLFVDLTSAGCHTSKAWVTRRGQPPTVLAVACEVCGRPVQVHPPAGHVEVSHMDLGRPTTTGAVHADCVGLARAGRMKAYGEIIDWESHGRR